MKAKKLLTLTLAAMLAGGSAFAQKIINYADYAGQENNARIVLAGILEENKGKEDLTIKFPGGRYDFYPETYRQEPPYDAGITVDGFKGLTIDGGGAEFVFHGMMKVADILNSERICFKDFSIDWDRPLLSQCRIVRTTDEYMDVDIDPEAYPYHIDGKGRITFYGEGWELPIQPTYLNILTPEGEIVYNTWDGTINRAFATARVERLGGRTLRFHYHQPFKPEPGCYIQIYHRRYAVSGIGASLSKDLLFENLTIYHTMSGGINCSQCENITEDGVRMVPNKAKGRIFSTVADASHFTNCKGDIIFRNCECSGNGDDFVNVHGRNVRVEKVPDANSVEVKASKWFFPGDIVALVGQVSGQREAMMTVEESGDGKVRFKESLPAGIDTTYFLENMTWTASLLFENNIVTKGNRARGILVTTPKPVVIRDNVFRSAGTAILIEGDTDYWFESGACENVTITGNVFDNCLTSGNRDGDRWQWGDAIITITPSHRPKDSDSPAYHKNIRIYGNEFRVFDVPLVRACSVDGLSFTRNKVVKTYDYKPYTWYKDSFTLEGCRNVLIKRNSYDPAYTTRTVKAITMKESDIKARGVSVDVR